MSLMTRLEQERGAAPAQANQPIFGAVAPDVTNKLRADIHREVVTLLNTQKPDAPRPDREQIRALIETVAASFAPELPRTARAKIETDILYDICGFGPLEELLADNSVSEIMVNGPYQIYVERSGKLMRADVAFRDDAHVLNVIDRIVSPLGRHIDEANPMVDARLPDGSRVNAVIPPLSVKGPVITIRKFSKVPLKISDLIAFGSLNSKMAAFLEACVRGKLNIVVSGGTGSGKTTLLNVLSSFIPHDERIVTIEDAAELQLEQDHVVTLESRPANLEGTGAVAIRDLVRNALRMRPDRIVVGEVRGGETLDMLQAMNTGHDGSLTTAHANGTRDLLSRLETMVLMAGVELPVRAIREQISAAVDVIIQQSRMRDGSRKIVSVSEVLGMEGDTIQMQELFGYRTTGAVDGSGRFAGEFVASGILPRCADKIRQSGVTLRGEWFEKDGGGRPL